MILSLANWLCASISVPGLAPPVFDRGDLLVDGSVLDTVPADLMRRHERGPVIAVDVTARVDVGVDRSCVENPTTWGGTD
jgi:NTE family protein